MTHLGKGLHGHSDLPQNTSAFPLPPPPIKNCQNQVAKYRLFRNSLVKYDCQADTSLRLANAEVCLDRRDLSQVVAVHIFNPRGR